MNGNRRFNLNKISDNIFVWTLPNFMQNDRVSVSIQGKRINSDEIIFTSNTVLIRDFCLDKDFEQYDMFNDIPIINIDDRKILMPQGKIIALNDDINSQFLMFRLKKFINGVDISKMGITINYVNALSESNSSTPVNVSSNLEYIHFAWLIDNSVSIIDGKVEFEIEITGSNSMGNPFIWQTLPSQLTISKSLLFDESAIIDRFPNILQQLKIDVNSLQNRVSDLEDRPIGIENLEDIIDNETIKVNIDNRLYVASGTIEGTMDHADLTHLDYDSSGHTGFASENDLNGYKNDLNSHKNNSIIHITAGEREKLILFKGFFLNSTLLIATYPTPTDGSYAIVGTGESATVWTSFGEIWEDTGSSGTVTMADLMEEVVNRENDVVRIDDDISDLESNLSTHKNDTSKHKTSIEQTKIDNLPNNTTANLLLKFDISDASELIKDVSQEDNSILFTRFNGSPIEIEIPEATGVTGGFYDSDTQELVLILSTGQEIRIPAAELISEFTGGTSSTIKIEISEDNIITANILENGIIRTLLSLELQTSLTDIESKKHIHDNKTIIDNISQNDIDNWNIVFDNTNNDARITTIETILPNKANRNNVLELDNTTPFNPEDNYQPATVKYVNDRVIDAVTTKLLFLDIDNGNPVLTIDKPSQNIIVLPTRYIGAEPNTWTEIININAKNDIFDMKMQFIPDNHFSAKIWLVSEIERNNVQIRIQMIDINDGTILASATNKTNLLSDGITPIPISFDNIHQILRDLPLSQIKTVVSIMSPLFGVQIGIISYPSDEISFINVVSTTGANATDIGELQTNIDILMSTKADRDNVLELNNTTPFTPTANYHPTTKEYVDNKIISGGTTIVDNLNGTSATEALSANQGRILNENKVDKVDGKSLIFDSEISRLLTVTNFDNTSNNNRLINIEEILPTKADLEDIDFIESPIDLQTEVKNRISENNLPLSTVNSISNLEENIVLKANLSDLNETSDMLDNHINNNNIHVTSTEKGYIGYLNGLTGNVQAQINLLQSTFGNSFVVETHSALSTISNPSERDLAFVKVDETRSNATTLYVFTILWEFVTIVEAEVRNFLINPINLSTETIGIILDSSLPSNLVRENQIENFVNVNEVLTKTNTTAYTPTLDYHPVTKKYIDDQMKIIDTLNNTFQSRLEGAI